MKRAGIALVGVLFLAGFAAHAETNTATHHTMQAVSHGKMHTQAASATKAADEPKTVTVSGELVDLGCYLGHGARGAGHKECATKCIANGMPMGVLTKEGKLYLLVLSHENADPYNKAKDMAAEDVSITGPVSMRNGMQAIQVDNIEMAAAKPATMGAKG